MQGFIKSALVGGRAGPIFNDILTMNDDGSFLMADGNNNQLDKDHPIKRIIVTSLDNTGFSFGRIIDGISVTYQLVNEGETTLNHGVHPSKPAGEVCFGEHDILLAVFGKSIRFQGPRAALVSSIGFIIYDIVSGKVRVEGPFGNDKDSGDRVTVTPYYSTNVIAFGGFAVDDQQSTGLAGLFFFKDLAKQ